MHKSHDVWFVGIMLCNGLLSVHNRKFHTCSADVHAELYAGVCVLITYKHNVGVNLKHCSRDRCVYIIVQKLGQNTAFETPVAIRMIFLAFKIVEIPIVIAFFGTSSALLKSVSLPLLYLR